MEVKHSGTKRLSSDGSSERSIGSQNHEWYPTGLVCRCLRAADFLDDLRVLRECRKILAFKLLFFAKCWALSALLGESFEFNENSEDDVVGDDARLDMIFDLDHSHKGSEIFDVNSRR